MKPDAPPTWRARVGVAREASDSKVRKGADGLVAIAKETLGQDPFSGVILVFRAKRGEQPTFRI